MSAFMMQDEEEIDPLTGQPLMPNTPRDPEDPREKMKSYLRSRLDSNPEMDLQRGSRDVGLSQLFLNAANQAGTIGGKAAGDAGFGQFAQGLQKQRDSLVSDDDRKMKIMQYLADKQGQEEKYRGDRQYQQDSLTAQREARDAALSVQRDRNRTEEENRKQTQKNWEADFGLRRQAANAKENKVTGASEGLKSLDRDYARDYNDWTSTGRSNLSKNLSLLEGAEKELGEAKGDFFTSGNVVGRAPDVLRTEKSKVIQQKVQEAAQGAMKAALGTAFTEGEGKRIMEKAYDPTLSSGENMKKIRMAIEDIKSKAADQEGKSRYFEKNQTLKDYVAPTIQGTGGSGGTPPASGLTPEEEAELAELEKRYGGN